MPTEEEKQRRLALYDAWSKVGKLLGVNNKDVGIVCAAILTDIIVDMAKDRDDAFEGLTSIWGDMQKQIGSRFEGGKH